MPTYTYKCANKACKNENFEFETTQRMSDDPLTECTVCAKDTLRKVLTPSGDFRIGGMAHGNTSMWNCSEDFGPRGG